MTSPVSVSKKTLVIHISFSIFFGISMVVKDFSTPSRPIVWWQKTFCEHPFQSLDGHRRLFATIQPLFYIFKSHLDDAKKSFVPLHMLTDAETHADQKRFRIHLSVLSKLYPPLDI